MIREWFTEISYIGGIPRESGDDPGTMWAVFTDGKYSPRERG